MFLSGICKPRLHGDWRTLVGNVQAEFDARLQAALKDSLLLLAEQVCCNIISTWRSRFMSHQELRLIAFMIDFPIQAYLTCA